MAEYGTESKCPDHSPPALSLDKIPSGSELGTKKMALCGKGQAERAERAPRGPVSALTLRV